MADSCDKRKKKIKGEDTVKGTPPPDVYCGEPFLGKLPDKDKDKFFPPPHNPVPDELKEPPEEWEEPEPELLLPGPLTIKSRAVTVYCEDPKSEGDPVSYPEGRMSQQMYFSAVLSIPENVLDYIARHKLEDEVSLLLNQGGKVEREMRRLTGMRLKEAKELLRIAKQIQDTLTEAVERLARSQLICCWWNEPQTAECEDPAMAHEWEHPDAVFSATIPEHTFRSCYSLEAANEEAMAAAQSMLNCFYLNDPFTARCEERPDRPLPVMDPVPNDEEEVYPGKGMRVGVVEVPGGKFTSRVSKEDANRAAQEWGYSQLVCWYPNDPLHAECSDPNARNLGVDPAVSSAHGADLDKGLPGQWVDIPEGYITSELSVEEATLQAQLLLEPLLQCCFINRPLILRCEVQMVKKSNGEEVPIEPAPYPLSPVPEVSVPGGKFTSCTSQEEADEFAANSVEGVLDCRYCNDPVLPTCVPDWVLRDVQLPEDHPDHIDLPLRDGEIYDTTHENLPVSSLPLNATRGSAGCEVLAYNAQEAQKVADMLASLLITQETEEGKAMCTYYNDKVIVSCASRDPNAPKDAEYNPAGYWATDQNGDPYYFYSMYSPEACLYDDVSAPVSGEYITIEAGMFMDSGEESKESLNKRAVAYAMTMLYCVMTNPPTEATCFWSDAQRTCTHFNDGRNCSYRGCKGCEFYNTAMEKANQFCSLSACAYANHTLCDEKWAFGQQEIVEDAVPPPPDTELSPDTTDPRNRPEMLMEWSNTPDRPLSIAKGVIFAIGFSEEEALRVIFDGVSAILTSQLRCDFGNYEVGIFECRDEKPYDAKRGATTCGNASKGELISNLQLMNHPEIPSKIFIDRSAAEATQQAYKMAQGFANCVLDQWFEYTLFIPEEPYSSKEGGGPGPKPDPGKYSSSPPIPFLECLGNLCYPCCPYYLYRRGYHWTHFWDEIPPANMRDWDWYNSLDQPWYYPNPTHSQKKLNKAISTWETDTTYSYEKLKKELEELEKELNELSNA